MRFFSNKAINNLIKSSFRAKNGESLIFNVSGYVKVILPIIILAIALIFFVFSQAKASSGKSFSPKKEAIHVFPSEITSPTWKNIETLNYQDLDEQSIFQDFNKSNSAYIDLNENNFSANQNVSQDENVAPITPTSDNPSEEQVVAPVNDSQTTEESSSTEIPAEMNSTQETTIPDVSNTNPVIENPTEAVPATPATPQDAPAQSASPVSKATFEGILFGKSSYISGFTLATGNFLLTQAETTTPGVTDILSSKTISAEPATQTDVNTAPDAGVSETSQNSDSLVGAPDTSVTSTTTVDENSATSSTQDESGESSSSEVISNTQANDTISHELVLRDFGIPELASGQFIDNLQLRLSLAGQYGDPTSTTFPSLEVKYSFGEFSKNAGTIFIENEISNAQNGGYFLIPLPSITDPALLKDLTITISVRGDTEQLKSLFIDSTWLEVGTVVFDKDLLKERFSPEEMLKHLDGLQTMDLLSNRLDFLREELPQFSLKYNSQRNFIIRALRSFFGQDLAKVDSVSFINNGGEPIGITPEVTVTADGLVSVVLTDADKERLLPGTYTIELTLDEGGYVTKDSFEFQWGLLSINTNQTEYTSNDVANISMGALSPNGNTLCDANLNLYITDPNGFISGTAVTPSGQCKGNNIIDVPDYSAQFVVGAPGSYEMYLERTDEAGNVLSHTTDTFLVADSQQVVIERNGPTRIFPPSPYAMELTVHALESSFNGELIERVPNNFKIFNTDAVIRQNLEYTELVWNVSLQKGENKVVSYEFDAPDLSPYLYELGPAQLVGEVDPKIKSQVIAAEAIMTQTSDIAPVTEVVPATNEVPIPESSTIDTQPAPVIEPAPSEEAPTPAVPDEVVQPAITPDAIPAEPAILPTESLPVNETTLESIMLEKSSYVSLLNPAVGDFLLAQAEVTEPIIPEVDATETSTNETQMSAPVPLPTMESTTVITTDGTTTPVAKVLPSNVVFMEHRQWQIASDATGNMILFWDDGASIPAGWTCLSCGSGAFFQNFAQGNSTYNTTGGATTHTPTATGAVAVSALATIGNGGGASTRVVGHTHTYTPTIGSASNLPLYRQLRVIQYTDGAGEPAVIPAGAIGIFDVASSSLPSGWTRYAAQDGYYARGENTPGTTGGANTHTHTITGTTGNAAGGTTGGGGGATGATAAHNHTVSTSTGSMSNEPPYIEVLFAKINTAGLPPNNLISMWSDAVPTGWTDVSSTGGNPFNGKFLKASTTYGGTGGGTTHAHANVNNALSSVPSATVNDAAGALGASNVHTHNVSITGFSNTNSLPPYLTVIFGKRANFNPFYTQTSSRWYVNTNNQIPSDVWPVGGTNIAEREAITATSSPVKQSEVVRLRINATVSNVTAPTGSTFKLQYGEGNVCSAVASWNDVGTTTSSVIWRGYNNATPADHVTLTSTVLGASTIKETYEENGYATVTPNAIPVSGVGEWDFVLQNNGATAGTNYCFRMIQGDSAPFFAYTSYPKLITDQVPDVPAQLSPFDNEKNATTSTHFSFMSTDSESDRLEYELTVDDTFDFSSPVLTKLSLNYPTDAGWASTTFASGATTTYIVQPADALTNGTTYWWRVRARDPQGSNVWSATSTVHSVTIDTSIPEREWYQTLGYQFERGVLTDTGTTTNNVIAVASATSTITNPSAWAQQYANTAYPAGTVNAAYSIAAGTDRVLLVAIASTRNAVGTQTVGVTYGGQSLTLAAGDGTNATNPNHTYLFYLKDSGISAASGSSLNVTITGGTSVYTYVHASIWAGVDQTSVFTDARNYFSGATANATVGPFAAGLTVSTGDQAIEIINLARSASGAAARTITTWSNGTWPAPSTIAATYAPGAGYAMGLHINNRNVTTAATEASGHTASFTGTLDSMSGISLKPAPPATTGTIMSPEVNFGWVSGQSDWGDISWNVTEPAGATTLLRVYYSSTTACDTIVPDATLAGNSTGFTASQSGILITQFATTTYNRICLNMTLTMGSATTSPTLNDWAISWVAPNQIPYTPTLTNTPAFEYEKSTTTAPTLGGFHANDYESNGLEYQIIVSSNYDLSSPTLLKQSSDYPTDAGWGSATFSAGATTTYNIQPADALTEGGTYWWAVRARDPSGSNTWSATSSVRSMTISTVNSVPQWYQTTDQQFGFDALSNATTSANSVGIETIGAVTGTITNPSTWAQQYANTAYPAGTVNAAYSIASGTDRILLVAVASTRTTIGTQTVSVNYGGQTLTMATGDDTNATNPNHTYFFYLNDAGISSAVGSGLSVTVTGGTSFYTYVYASVWADVDQTTLFTDTQNYFSGVTYDNAVGPFASGLTVNTGDQAIEIVNLARSTTGNGARTVTTWSNGTWPTPSTVATTRVVNGTYNVGLHINNRNSTTSGTESSQHTANSAATQDSMSGIVLKVTAGTSAGSAMSTEVDHNWVPNQNTWGEISWKTTESTGSDTRTHLYYTNGTTCDTIVPDAALSGNSVGFDASQSPINISALSTTTYNRICLKVDFEQGSAITSPILDDWTVRWALTPQFTEADYRWYVNKDDFTPTDPWPAGAVDLVENEAIDVENTVPGGGVLRLRMSLTGSSTTATAGSVSFKLQYAEGAVCSASLNWYDIGDTASSTALWRGYNNASIADATTLPSALLTNSDVYETYEEHNNSYPNPTTINSGQNAEWDWTLKNNLAVSGTSYCFRMVYSDGALFKSYNNYPGLVTNSSPNVPILSAPFNNEKIASTSPWFEFVSNDAEGNPIDYQIQIDNNADFSSTVIDTDSSTNLTDFANTYTPSDKSPFNNAEKIQYTIPSSLTNGVTYWWRSRAIDANGSAVYGGWSSSQSFTVETTVTISTWFQTTQEQFDTDVLEGTDATAGNLVSFASGSTTGTTTSSAIDFAEATKGNAWGEFSFNETGAANTILYHLEYYADGAWSLIPDSALAGNATGYDTSPVNLLNLDSSTYNLIRIRANFISAAPTLLDWTIAWGERVSVPTHTKPFDNEKFATTSPTFTFSTIDPQGDELEYEISWSTDYTFVTGSTTINSSSSPTGFVNLTTGGDISSPFISGDTIAYKVQPANVLTASSTYWWRSRAKDPFGSNSFSFWSDPWSFTTATSGEPIAVSTWYQTLGLQFAKGILTGAVPTLDSVSIGNGITLQSASTSITAVPGITLTLTKPTGVAVGDLLLIIVGNDANIATAQWNNTTLKPTGFTLINEAGNATPDAHVAAFYRVADGTEGATINVTAQSSRNYYGHYIRLTGVDTANPINVTGADYAVNNLVSHAIPSITTTVDQTLAIYVLAADGGDNYPFSVSGAGWVQQNQIQAGAGALNSSGTWGIQTMPTAGATGAATVTMTLNDGASGFQFALRPAVISSGVIKSPVIDFDDGNGPAWGTLSWSDIEPGSSELLYQLQYLNNVDVWTLIPDSALSGNSTGFGASPINLEALNTATYNEIRIVGNLNCSGVNCPTLDDWKVEWSRGFTVSGTAFEYDGVSSTTAGSVAIAVNGNLQIGTTGTIDANGYWSINDVTFFVGDVLTVFVSGATDVNEATAVTVYDGVPDVTGMRLVKRHLTIGSDDNATVTNVNLGAYDFTNSEDLFYNVNAGNDLTMCADAGCSDAGIIVLANNTFTPGVGADVTTHDFTNNGTFTSGANTDRISGSWDNNGSVTMTGSSLIFTATSTAETVDSTGSGATFNTVTFGETSGTATWALGSTLTIGGNLQVTYGTLARNTNAISISGNLTTGANGTWTGIATTTFDGINPGTWTDSNATKQNVGHVVVDGTSKTLILGSAVVLQSMQIGANDIFDTSITGYGVSVYGDWVNTNTFTARTGTVNFIATTTNKIITAGSSAFYNLNFGGVGGSWSFTDANLSVTNDFTIATGTVTMPTGTTTVSGSFTNSGGTFAHNNATVLMNASGAKTITTSGTPFTNAFYNLTFSGTGSWSFTEANATTSNDFRITQGTVTAPSAMLSVGGSYAQTGGSFVHNSGTVRFTSAGARTIDVNGSSFNSLSFTGSGSWSFIDTSVITLGSISVTNGTLALPSGTLTLGGSFTNTATVTHNNGTVLFNSTDGGETVSLGSSPLYNMTFASPTGGWTISENATTTNNFNLATSSSFALSSGKTLSVGSVFVNAVGGTSTTWAGSTLSLEAGNYNINAKTNSGDAYDTLRIKANTDIKMWNSTSTTYIIDSTSSLYSQDHNGVDGSLYIFGEYVRASGTENWSYGTDFDGTVLTASTSRQVAVRLASSTTASFTTSTLSIVGTTTGSTTIANQGSGTYTLSVLNGTTTASRYDFANLGNTGLTLSGTTKVTSISDGRFSPYVASGTALTVSSTTIDANPGLQIYRVDFSTTTAITAQNVTQNNGTPASFWWFRESIGNIDGEAFDNDTGDPGSIRWDDSSLVITVSGTVYSDDGLTKMAGPTCDDATQNIRVVIQGGSTYTGSCASANGTFSIAGVVVVGDPVVTVYLDTNGGAQGTVITKTPTANITNLDIYQNRIITRHEDVVPLTILNMAAYDSSDDSDIQYTAATGTLTVFAGNELHVASSTTFAPGGDITIIGNASSTSQDGSFHVDDNAIFVGSGTSTYTIGGSFTIDAGATFSAASSTVFMNATTTGKTITTPSTQEIIFNALTITGIGGGWNLNGDIRVLGNMQVNQGTLTGTRNVRVMNGSLSGNGTLSFGSGTTTIENTNTLGGTTPWTFSNLVLGNTSATGTTTPGGATTTILGKLTIATGHYLKGNSSVWNLAGTGNVFAENGTFIEDTTTVKYSGTGATNILGTTYYNLDLKSAGGAPTYTATGIGMVVTNNLIVGGATTTTVNFDTNDTVLDVNGNVTIDAAGTLIGSGSAAFTVAGSWDNNGTFTGSNGTVTFDNGGTKTIATGASAFSNLIINGSGTFTISENATTTGACTLTSATGFTLSSGQTLAVGGVFTNSIGGAATTWTGSTLALYGSGNYTINAKSTNDVYETLMVRANTDIRMWNSSASSYLVDATGSLYSEDHSGVDGDLYIYGDFAGNGGNEYWNYATDFDGASLSGNERSADVYFANGASMNLISGGLSVVGSTGASTTIQNQGGGTYGLHIGGTASTTWSYYRVRNLDTSGLTFSGTPNVITLSYGDIEVSQNSGTAITVGGTVLTQNPAKTFTGNYFGTSTGIFPAYNVTATGTSVSSWRFTNYGGSIAGEAHDVDPNGDPGYIVWDDSASFITISGTVYTNEGSGINAVCDGVTNNIALRVQGLTSYATNCNAGTGAYSISGVVFSPGDSFVVYIDNETQKAATVSEDPISSIGNMDLYENRVIVRHENTDPLSIADMSLWDSSDDADIPFTAVNAGTDTLTLPSDKKLIVWSGKTFQPNGNVTLSGGGAGAAYDGTLELYASASFVAAGSETHSIGGSLISGGGATFTAANSTVIFTTTGASRTVDTNQAAFYNLTFSGSGSWTVSDATMAVGNDFTITQGGVTLPNGTTTVTGSLNVTGGTWNANGGTMLFNSTGAETIKAGGSNWNALTVNGAGSFVMQGTNATATADVRIQDGIFTSATGTLTIGGNFINNDIFNHGSGILRFTATTSTQVTASGSDLYTATFAGSGPFTFTDHNEAFLGSLTILGGAVNFATGTMSIGGSLTNIGGSFTHGSGTILFNSSDVGETINPGASPFYAVSFASAGGGWTISGDATTTSNFSLTSAANFTLASSTKLNVGGVFTNLVGGAATTWTGSTLAINSGSNYTINTKAVGGDSYNNLLIGSSTVLRAWDSTGVVAMLDSESSFYSQDNAGASGSLYIYGNYGRSSGSDYWSYATDFDGTALGGSSRQVYIYMASTSTTTLSGGALNIVGTSAFATIISNQGSGTYALTILGGTFNAQYYSILNINGTGLYLSGTTLITSLAEGNFTLGVNGGSLITVSSTTVNYNTGLVSSGNSFATTSAITGYNVSVIGTTPGAWTFTGHTGNLDGEGFDNDGGDACGSIRWDDSSCLLTQQSGYRFRNDDGGEGVPNSEWYNGSWSKRKRVTISNADAKTYTNAAVKFTVAYDSDMQADFDDLRFTSSDGVTSLDYFIESYSASTNAVVWIKVPTLATSTNANVYMYYGNGSVSDASATSTFSFIDNFEDGNISEYSGDTGLFTVGGSFAKDRAYGLDATGNESAKATDGIYRTDVTVAKGETIRYFQYIDTTAGSGDETCTMFGVQSPGSNNQNYAVCLELFGVDRISLARDVDWNDASGVVLASTTISYSTGWYEVEVDWNTSNLIAVTVSQNGSVVATTSATDSTYASGGVGYTFWFQNGGWDLYSARPLLTTEPTVTTGFEQVAGGASWLSSFNSPGTGVIIGDKVRARFLVENTGLPVTNQNYQIEYAAKGASPSCEAVAYGDYAPVPTIASCGTSPICMETSSYFTNLASTTDILGGVGTFTYGQMVEDGNNNTGNITIGSNAYTELEYVISPNANVTDSNYCFRVSNTGADLDAYTHVGELSFVFAPNITALSLNEGLDITLMGGATTTVYATGTVSDLNGYTDLAGATSTIFRSGVGESCSLDNNNCYISGNSKCAFINCSGNSCDVSCSADIYYHADPTDIGTFAGETWRALLAVSDIGGLVATATAPSIDLMTLRSIAVDSNINYGSLEVNADTGAYNATTTVQNIGNDALDISIEGTDLTDGGSSIIPVAEQKFATSTFTYSACVSCSSLSTSPTNYKLNLAKPASTTPAITDELFWGIAVPFGVAGTAHHGTNIFYAIGVF